MENDRYQLLMEDNSVQLTKEERAEGWHFCEEWDGLLVGPEMAEEESCRCVLPGKRDRDLTEE